MSRHHLYFVYGLLIDSDDAIPGLKPVASSSLPDISLYLAGKPIWLPDALAGRREPWDDTVPLDPSSALATATYRIDGGKYIEVRFLDGTRFIINTAIWEMWSTWPESFAVTDVTLYLLGPILGFVLALRGVPVLHASAICLDGRAVALIGSAGAGKSTTAAAFALQGIPVLTEDVTALQHQGAEWLVFPGYPTIRLWPSSVAILFGNEGALPALTPGWDKKGFSLEPELFLSTPYPLAAIYYLVPRADRPDSPRVEPMSGAEAIIALVSNVYSQFPEDMKKKEFNILSGIAQTVPMRRATPHVDPARIGELCDRIIADFATIA